MLKAGARVKLLPGLEKDGRTYLRRPEAGVRRVPARFRQSKGIEFEWVVPNGSTGVITPALPPGAFVHVIWDNDPCTPSQPCAVEVKYLAPWSGLDQMLDLL